MESVWIASALFVSFIISVILGKIVIPLLRKLHFGQTILTEYGPTWHSGKQGTPNMGGILFIFSTLITYLIFCFSYYTQGTNKSAVMGLIVALLFAFLGFADDFVKVKKKRNLGLTASQKIILQILISTAYIIFLGIRNGWKTTMLIPFTNVYFDFSIFYYIIALIIMVGFTNAVNLTDGVDGLAGSVTLPICVTFLVISIVFNQGNPETAILSAALAGGIIGFLIFNWHPAKVFMGDVGSMFLGGMVCILAFEVNMPLILLIVGVIYLIEALSVMLQVTYFKLTHGKRIFKMSPIHHHFEMCGYSEVKIVCSFTFVTVVACAAVCLWILL